MKLDAETTRVMENWAGWRRGDSIGAAVSSAYRDVRDAYDMPLPLINGEAVDVQKAIDRLEPHQAKAVEEFWVRRGQLHQIVRACGCSKAALYRRLDQAHRFIHAFLAELKTRAERLRKERAHSQYENRAPERDTSGMIQPPLRLVRKDEA